MASKTETTKSPIHEFKVLADQSLLTTVFNVVITLKKYLKPCFFFILEALQVVNWRIRGFVYWCHEQVKILWSEYSSRLSFKILFKFASESDCLVFCSYIINSSVFWGSPIQKIFLKLMTYLYNLRASQSQGTFSSWNQMPFKRCSTYYYLKLSL